jgi:hypothetical protein
LQLQGPYHGAKIIVAYAIQQLSVTRTPDTTAPKGMDVSEIGTHYTFYAGTVEKSSHP